jgi:hypothetical protein
MYRVRRAVSLLFIAGGILVAARYELATTVTGTGLVILGIILWRV